MTGHVCALPARVREERKEKRKEKKEAGYISKGRRLERPWLKAAIQTRMRCRIIIDGLRLSPGIHTAGEEEAEQLDEAMDALRSSLMQCEEQKSSILMLDQQNTELSVRIIC